MNPDRTRARIEVLVGRLREIDRLTLSEIASILGMSPSAGHKFVARLCRAGLIVRVGHGIYRLVDVGGVVGCRMWVVCEQSSIPYIVECFIHADGLQEWSWVLRDDPVDRVVVPFGSFSAGEVVCVSDDHVDGVRCLWWWDAIRRRFSSLFRRSRHGR